MSTALVIMLEMISNCKVMLRDKNLSDVRNDYLWQTDPELSSLDASPVLRYSFQRYLLDYPRELRLASSRNRCSFAIDTLDGKHIGNCVCYNIDRERGNAEIGIMIGDRDYWDRGYGTDAFNALVDYIFNTEGFTRLYLKTLNWNSRAQNCFRKCGFTPYGRMSIDGYDFVLMDLHQKKWEKRDGKGEIQ